MRPRLVNLLRIQISMFQKLLLSVVAALIVGAGATAARADAFSVVGNSNPNATATLNIISLSNNKLVISITNTSAGVVTGFGFALNGANASLVSASSQPSRHDERDIHVQRKLQWHDATTDCHGPVCKVPGVVVKPKQRRRHSQLCAAKRGSRAHDYAATGNRTCRRGRSRKEATQDEELNPMIVNLLSGREYSALGLFVSDLGAGATRSFSICHLVIAI